MKPHTTLRQLALASTLALASASSHALIAWAEPSASIIDAVIGTASHWNYSYTVTNTTDCYLTCDAGTWYGEQTRISQFALPFFTDAGIDAIASPTGWSSQVSASDLFNLGSGTKTIIWTADSASTGILVGNTLSGFGYQANYSAGKGPYQITQLRGASALGDPAIPLSPLAQTAGIQPMTLVDEPASSAMLVAGLGLMGFIVNRRRSRGA